MAEVSSAVSNSVRTLVLNRAIEKKLDLKTLSLAAGLNETYFQQFIRKGVPRRLPSDVRDFLASALEVPADSLGPVMPARRRSRYGKRKSNVIMLKVPQARKTKLTAEPMGSAAPFPVAGGRARNVPIYSCPGIAAEAGVVGWTDRPVSLQSTGETFAIWATEPIGRVRAGDLLFIHSAQPPRRDDAVLIMCDRKILCIGELLWRKTGEVGVLTPMGKTTFDIASHQIARICLALFP